MKNPLLIALTVTFLQLMIWPVASETYAGCGPECIQLPPPSDPCLRKCYAEGHSETYCEAYCVGRCEAPCTRGEELARVAGAEQMVQMYDAIGMGQRMSARFVLSAIERENSGAPVVQTAFEGRESNRGRRLSSLISHLCA